MFLYSFDMFAGFDRVFLLPEALKLSFSPGDLIQSESHFFLVLGDEIVFPELYRHVYIPLEPFKLIYPSFFDQPFLSFLHWMVEEWYSPYKSVMKCFVSHDIISLLQRETKVKKSEKVSFSAFENQFGISMDDKSQSLIVFPDLWSLYNCLEESQFLSSGVSFFSSTDTQNQKDLHWWMMKKGIPSVVFTTHSEVFQPFSPLKNIVLIEPHTWYYNNQQDPRYHLPSVLQKQSEVYGATLRIIDFLS